MCRTSASMPAPQILMVCEYWRYLDTGGTSRARTALSWRHGTASRPHLPPGPAATDARGPDLRGPCGVRRGRVSRGEPGADRPRGRDLQGRSEERRVGKQSQLTNGDSASIQV